MSLNIVIVEDEPLAAAELKRLLALSGNHYILAELESVRGAVDWFRRNPPPDLVFMDIHLADGLSFAIFEQCELKAPVVFLTAYDQYALKAFEVNGVDYLLKPADQASLERALSRLQPAPDRQLMDVIQLAMQGKSVFRTRFLSRSGDTFTRLPVSDIAWIYADDDLVFAYSHKGRRHLLEEKLEALELQMDPAMFFRVNRSFIVNCDAIGAVHRYFNARLKIDLIPPSDSEVIVSRARARDFLNWLQR